MASDGGEGISTFGDVGEVKADGIGRVMADDIGASAVIGAMAQVKSPVTVLMALGGVDGDEGNGTFAGGREEWWVERRKCFTQLTINLSVQEVLTLASFVNFVVGSVEEVASDSKMPGGTRSFDSLVPVVREAALLAGAAKCRLPAGPEGDLLRMWRQALYHFCFDGQTRLTDGCQESREVDMVSCPPRSSCKPTERASPDGALLAVEGGCRQQCSVDRLAFALPSFVDAISRGRSKRAYARNLLV